MLLEEKSRDKTAFTVPGRPLYQFKVMPFGLCNPASTMSQPMDKVVPPHLRNEVFVYLDDLLIISSTFDAHMSVLQKIAFHIKRAGLTINVGKSHFCMQRVRYLGHIIGDGGIRTDPEKVKAISQFPIPKNLKSLRSFMGLCSWYRTFVPNFASLSSALTDAMTTKRKFQMSEEAVHALAMLKRKLTETPVLHSPDLNKPFFIQCDASKTGVGGVLVQHSEKGDECPLAFVSKKLNKGQQNYTVTEQECLAAIACLKMLFTLHSERVNRSVLSGINSYIRPDQKDWDEYLHASIGTTPYYMAFGHHMVSAGSEYALLRKLNLLEDRSLTFNRKDSFEIVRRAASSQMRKSHEQKRTNI